MFFIYLYCASICYSHLIPYIISLFRVMIVFFRVYMGFSLVYDDDDVQHAVC